MDLKQESQSIIDSYGANTAKKVIFCLKDKNDLSKIETELNFLAKTWYDPLTPGLITLAFHAVKGKNKNIQDIAIALGLVNLTINLWDDILDDDTSKLFRPTFYGKFGKEASLIVGGLALAKAYKILTEAEIEIAKKKAISDLVWHMWSKLGIAEIKDCRLRPNQTSDERFSKIANEAIYTETLMRIGSTLGNSGRKVTSALGCYGYHLGIILEASKDLEVSLNLTSKLSDRLCTGNLPFSIIWAIEHSKKAQRILEDVKGKRTIKPSDIKNVVSVFLEIGVFEHVTRIIEASSEQAIEALDSLDDTIAKMELKKFVGAQPQLFRERLLVLS